MKYVSQLYIENCACQVAGVESTPGQNSVNDVSSSLEDEELKKNVAQGKNDNQAGLTKEFDKMSKKKKKSNV